MKKSIPGIGKGFLTAAASVAFVAALPAPAQAATQGTFGANSEGSVDITASVPSRARISGLSDIAFTNQDPESDASDAQDVCVWTNTANGNYTITATGDGASNAFTLANGALTVPYSVEWNASSGETSGNLLDTGDASGTLSSAATTEDCSSGSSASLIVGIPATDLQSMQAGLDYTGSLTLLVTPQ